MRIAICEDSQLDRELLVDVVGHYAAQRSRAIQVTAYDGGLGLVRDMEDGGYYDLVFLDNLMDDMLGIQVARRLRELNYQGPLVFISSTDAYAVAGYEVSAAAYLLKPYDYQTVAAVLDKFLPETGPEERYAIRRRAAVIQLPYQDILFVESQNAKCILHCRDGQTHVVYKTLNTVEGELGDRRFLRCHQSFLVNMDEIISVDQAFHLSSGDAVPIRQRELKRIRASYLDYLAAKERARSVAERLPSVKPE